MTTKTEIATPKYSACKKPMKGVLEITENKNQVFYLCCNNETCKCNGIMTYKMSRHFASILLIKKKDNELRYLSK